MGLGRRRDHLRPGFTTGTAAAAATKAALMILTGRKPPDQVYVPFLSEGGVSVAVHRICREGPDRAAATVIKDAGDDPDVTHGAEIGARVAMSDLVSGQNGSIRILGGPGVGRVTLPGLEIAPGEPAINPGPRRMIFQAVADVLQDELDRRRVEVEIFVPDGEALAARTLNRRLGIVGGISILGTSGIVRPMSHEAYTATIAAAMKVARAEGIDRLVLTTGRRSERFAQLLWPERSRRAFVQIGDFFAFSLETAAGLGIRCIDLAVFFGKAVKMAEGLAHTHARSAPLALTNLGDWTLESTGHHNLARAVGQANTARQALDLILPDHPQVLDAVAGRMITAARHFGGKALSVEAMILNYDGTVLFGKTP